MKVTIECLCPPTADGGPRHESDTVTLRDTLDYRSAMSIRNAVLVLKGDDEQAAVGEVLATIQEASLLFGIEAWTLTDEKNKPIPCTRSEIRARLMTHFAIAAMVGDAADELYRETVILPLLVPASKSSPPSPTKESTSVANGSGSKHPKQSKPSSTTSTPTDATVATSPSLVGVSSTSQSSASAA